LESELVDGNRGMEISCFASKDSPFQKYTVAMREIVVSDVADQSRGQDCASHDEVGLALKPEALLRRNPLR